MSVEEVKNIRSAYEKMLEDGTAYKEVDMTMHNEPDMEVVTGKKDEITAQPALTENPLGEVVDEHNDNDNDYTEFDSVMEQRINSLRNKMQSGGVRKTPRPPKNNEIASLKNRVKKLEEAMMLIMETHERLLG